MSGFFSKIEKSFVLVIIGVLLLFSLAIAVVVIAPSYIDKSWIEPSCYYQQQMYEVADPNIFLNAAAPGEEIVQYVYCIKEDFSLLSFEESDTLKIIAADNALEKYITKNKEEPLKLTKRLLFLRDPHEGGVLEKAKKLQEELQKEWQEKKVGDTKPFFQVLELYVPHGTEGFAVAADGVVDCWTDKAYILVKGEQEESVHNHSGTLYIKNPQEYRISYLKRGLTQSWQYDPAGKKVTSIEELTGKELGFISRKDLIKMGEDIYKQEGCWYCHTDQSRTLVQDCVANGSDSYPAPPSSANEYIYQEVTFPGTRRIGPDLARVGVKRPSRDWHKAHFWAPKTKSKGSIMPSYRHFFDEDSSSLSKNPYGVPNYKFEAIYQYLMTKGTRITSPAESWWLGLDPIQTIKIIEGRSN